MEYNCYLLGKIFFKCIKKRKIIRRLSDRDKREELRIKNVNTFKNFMYSN